MKGNEIMDNQNWNNRFEIYDRRQAFVNNERWQISMVRNRVDMHIQSPSTGEVCLRDLEDNHNTDPVWVGHAADAGDAFNKAVDVAVESFNTLPEDADFWDWVNDITEVFLPEDC